MSEGNNTTPKWRRIALPISIVLNLFLIAVIGGHMLHFRFRQAHFDSPLARALAHAEAVLPAADAAKFGGIIRRDAPHYMDAARQLGEARKELDRQILAEPFDKDGMRRALNVWSTAWDRFLSDFSDPLIEALGEVSPEGRRKLIAERRAERFKATLP